MAAPIVTPIPLAAQPLVPWRNGGGTTREVAAARDVAHAEFRWRVSIAQVTRDGPFSAYPGVDRTLWLLRGAGLRLVIDGSEVLLDRPYLPLALRGESSVTAALIDGPTEDLNVMVERTEARTAARVLRLAPRESARLTAAPGTEAVLLALDAALEARIESGSAHVLAPGDALHAACGRATPIAVTAGKAPAAMLFAVFERPSGPR